MPRRRIQSTACLLVLGLLGEAKAFDLEMLVMPGPLSQAHAETEEDCGACHQPFSQDQQRELCLACHEVVADDLHSESGLHGRDPRVKKSRCRDCHSEHLGRDGDILGFNRESFQHRSTDFQLRGRHAQVRCTACHESNKRYRDAPGQCVTCHIEDDTHRGGLGEDCASCHSEEGWKGIDFDHASTEFALEGNHAQVDCRLCHAGERYKDTPRDCRACHATDDAHGGSHGNDCARCHEANDWTQSIFDHAAETKFALLHRHAEAACSTCHEGPLDGQQLETRCAACHATDDSHQGRNGPECEECHSEKSWAEPTFDHGRETDFPLRGRHADVACQHCHSSDPHGVEIPAACIDCHTSDDAHAGSQGRDCAQCHDETGWRAHIRFDHDISAFPLLGLHAIEACESCHESTRFQDTERKCVVCHEEDDAHEQKLGNQCERCHNPNGWSLWRFDHDQDTAFPLRGGHEGLGCLGCHTRPTQANPTQTSECGACHDFDDVHGGGFGRDCGRCHNEERWSEVKVDSR